MNSDQHIWDVWADSIHRWGMQEWVASLLDAAGPFTVLGAQAVYIGLPLVQPAVPRKYLDALARLLEDRTQAQAFAAFLREEPSHEPV